MTNTLRSLSALVVAAVALTAAVVASAEPSASASRPATSPAVVSPAADRTQDRVGRAAKIAAGPAAVIRIEGQVDDYMRDQLFRRFDRARRAGAKSVVLEIDTYGGLVSSGLDISRYLKNQSDLYVVAFVNSKAISAGAMIAMACDEIVMTPSGTLGDCAPIQVAPGGGGVVPMGQTERSKAESPILADFRESAARNGHDPVLAVAMVSIPYTAYWVQDDKGARRFVDADEFKRLTADGGGWAAVPGEPTPVDGPETLLTVHTAQAVKYGLAKGTATSAEAVAADRGLAVVARYDDGWGDWFVSLLASPIARMLYLIVFVNALFIAIKTPGTGAPEAIAILALALLVGMPLLTGHAQWWQALMIVAGVALVLFEVFVFPGVVVGLVAGLVLVVAGVILTFVGDAFTVPGAWSLAGTQAALERGIWTTVGGLGLGMLVFAFVRQYLPRIPLFNRIILTAGGPPAGAEAALPGLAAAEDDAWPFAGTVGVAVTDLKPGGTAQFPYGDDTRATSVVSESGYIPAGSRLTVREVHGNRVVVRQRMQG